MICVVGRSPEGLLGAVVTLPLQAEKADGFFRELGLVLEGAHWTVLDPKIAGLPDIPPQSRSLKRYSTAQAALLGFDKILVLGENADALRLVQLAIDTMVETYVDRLLPSTDAPSLN